MTFPHQPQRAAGFFIVLGVLGGVVVGALLGQPSAGFLIGLGLGIAIALGMWLTDRRN